MFQQIESKPQGWRAVAVFNDDRHDALLYLGRSSTQVRAGYVEAFTEVLDDEERAALKEIQMHHWQGAPDDGRWTPHSTLRVPAPNAGKPEPVEEVEIFSAAA